jgi:hypothetical protein
MRSATDRHPHLERVLRRQVVKIQRGEQAEHALRNELSGFDEALVLAQFGAGQPIQSAPGSLDQSTLFQPLEMNAMNALSCQFARSHHARPLHHFQDAGSRGLRINCIFYSCHSVTVTLHISRIAEIL